MNETTPTSPLFSSSSHASSHFPIQPLPASLLVDREVARKEWLAATNGGGEGTGNLMMTTGCRGLDEYVLLGGLERGSVVGVSAEGEDGEDEVGLLIGLQTAGNLLASRSTARVMVVTTLPATVLLPKLRRTLVGQLARLRSGLQNLKAEVQACLERISIARVFDIEGLWEVLRELEDAVPTEDGKPPQPVQPEKKTEIMDSEDEGGLSSSDSPPSGLSPQLEPKPSGGEKPSALPEMILVTHTSTLLSTLFTGRDRDTAHSTMLFLASHLHALTRSQTHGAPLFMFINSTTSPAVTFPHPPRADDDNTPAAFPTDPSRPPPPPSSPLPKHIDSTLCSIFNPPLSPPVLHTVPGAQAQPGPGAFAAAATSSVRRNKPSFGLVFSQMLDLHLLCTRVPRTRADSAALMVNPGVGVAGVSYVWIVEVLLDELGVYEELAGGGWDWGKRRSREQRWGPVVVDEEGRIVDATFR
ncbi:hypothetical protein C7999DRAFT_38104 [Corynascus novoguineensis]|uniref:Uncharacterized protein n=1 Tax=Corynascus novoguineensis TaxID=1126955 RepID=A0AAN7D0Z9_9PEZI|nr:hypothetical protein C7999DRAFT_38104 [Corynascus novoguineensis]